VLTGATLRKLANGENVGATGAVPGWAKFGVERFGHMIDRHATPERIRKLADWWLPVGKRVVVVGADLAGIELAEFLAKRDRDVAIVTSQEDIAPEIGPKRRLEHEKRLERLKVSINTATKVERITANGVELGMPSGKTAVVHANSVIVTGEPVADTSLHEALTAAGLSAHAIGDSTGLGLIVKAVYEGAELANRL
jgi:2,4-dienoyl-CoA reductase (NADPH2)